MVALLQPLPRESVLTPEFWRFSPAIPVRERPVRPVPPPDPPSLRREGVPWLLALDALTNAGEFSLTYDDWRTVIFGIHHESAGSDEGLALAQAWSARSPKHDPEFLASRVWPYIRDEREGAVTTGRSIMSLAARLEGWSGPPDASGFTPMTEDGEPLGWGPEAPAEAEIAVDDDDLTGIGLVATPGGAVVSRSALQTTTDLTRAEIIDPGADPAVEQTVRRGIPPAQHLCTDQANANRLVKHYGAHLIVAAKSWYVWDGRRWARDESEVYRRGCQLSRIIKDECAEVRMQLAEMVQANGGVVDPKSPGMKALKDLIDGLDKWSTRSEMKSTITAAIELAAKMLAVDPESLDANPWLLCVKNGVIDLRTGQLGPHRHEHRITKLVGVDFRPGARSEVWEQMVEGVVRRDRALGSFLQRWFGYCATGDVREQKIVVHWGSGGNGKSTIMESISHVLGDYAGVAAAGLVVGKGDAVHSSAVVALVGKRMITAHESGDGGVMSEDFVKKATGGDRLDARYLYGEQFAFNPTHKLQLLTNHKPQIRGTDPGIWRRVLLVPYVARFARQDEIDSGLVRRDAVDGMADPMLAEVLRQPSEQEGILAWVVRGAVEWFHNGLRPPSVVLAAGEAYRTEQDRVGQFIVDECELGADFSEPLVGIMDRGLYPAYKGWCRESGILALSKQKFVHELERCVPGFRTQPGRASVAEGRGKVTRIYGVRLVGEG